MMKHVNIKSFLTKKYINIDCLVPTNFICDVEFFEEIPLIDKYYKVDGWKNVFSDEVIFSTWISLAHYLLFMYKPYAVGNRKFLLTFTEFDESELDFAYLPNLYICNKAELYKKIINYPLLDEGRIFEKISNAFLKAGLKHAYSFRINEFFDEGSEELITRVYCLLEECS